jgi:3-isopropylmalate dehydrogenase
MEAVITLLPGDGIGPEVTAEAVRVLRAVERRWEHRFTFREALIGGIAIDQAGTALPEETTRLCRESDAVFLGAVGGPKWDDPSAKVRPEQGLLGIRKALGLYANLRPVRFQPAVADASPLRRERLEGVDLIVVRELTGGIYFGDKARSDTEASDTCVYTAEEVDRIARVAFDAARRRRNRVTSVDKANVLETSRLWREVVAEIAFGYPDVELDHLLVDNAAMQLVSAPAEFDVILTENMFGDILSDEAAMLTGSLGMLPSASLGDDGPGLFEPVHGSAPDIAGSGAANPLATILSAALLLRHGLALENAADRVDAAVEAALADGLRTADLGGGAAAVGTEAISDRVLGHLETRS